VNNDLREKLRRLGVHKGAAHLTNAARPAPVAPDRAEERLRPVTPGARGEYERIRTPFGEAVVRRTRYGLHESHGNRVLREGAARLSAITPNEFDLTSAVFVDTETTGLAGGAGTLAFLVGAGYFEDNEFVVAQYFLADPAQEEAMLADLDKLVSGRENLVTFNGRAFDIPLLDTRFTLARMPSPFADKTHLDLLLPARRVWRNSLSSCSLGSLEFHVLGVHRDQQDIAGFLIPQLYREYLQTGDMTEMERVMYHNLLDVLSMVTLAAKLNEVFTRPASAAEHLALARQHEQRGEMEQSIAAYRQSLDGARGAENVQATRRLAAALKRLNRHEEALEYWETLAGAGDFDALIELAKYYEWQVKEYALAADVAARAWASAITSAQRLEAEKRLARLKAKQSKA